MTEFNEWEVDPNAEIPPQLDERMLKALRFIILREERDRLQALESKSDSAEQQIDALEARLAELSERLGDEQALVNTLEPVVAPVISRKISENRDEMAKTIGPIIGDSIRVQLSQNREDIVDALYPIIGETVAKSVRESFRELRRSIDRQLKRTVEPANIGRNVQARLRGVSAAELAMRDALPFELKHIFLIQHDTGHLLSKQQFTDTEMSPGLIGGMLTAIRQFAKDSFGREGHSDELDEIQYGDERIIIESGRHAYVAAVVEGNEPTQFRQHLRDYIANLHFEHGTEIENYDGDVESIAHLQTGIIDLSDTVTQDDLTYPSQPEMGKYAVPLAVGLGCLALLALLGFILCVFLTTRLWDDVFPTQEPTPTAIIVPTSTNTPLPSNTPTPVPPTSTIQPPTSTPLPTDTAEPSTAEPSPVPPEPTATTIPTEAPPTTEPVSPTNTPEPSVTLGNVWVLDEPEVYEKRSGLLLRDTPVFILAAYGDWVQIEWMVTETNTIRTGWVLQRWIGLSQPIPESIITPVPTP